MKSASTSVTPTQPSLGINLTASTSFSGVSGAGRGGARPGYVESGDLPSNHQRARFDLSTGVALRCLLPVHGVQGVLDGLR